MKMSYTKKLQLKKSIQISLRRWIERVQSINSEKSNTPTTKLLLHSVLSVVR